MRPQAWTFNHKIAAGFAATLLVTLSLGALATASLRSLATDKDELLSRYAEPMRRVQHLDTLLAETMSHNRGYYMTGDARYLTSARQAQDDYDQTWLTVSRAAPSGLQPRLFEDVERARQAYLAASRRLVAQRRASDDVARVADRFDREVRPLAQALRARMDALTARLTADMEAAKERSSRAAERALAAMGAIAGLGVLLAAGLALWLTRTLSHQLGLAVSHLQSSSAELHAAANQQAMGSGEQATAMSEVSTTMKELIATSRQIAQSAHRVARVADETAQAAHTGGHTVERADASVSAIRRQVDLIVAHMLDLGRKTQQIGAILEIIKELAEQTNILSINATIEAAGAGESGKRFAAVAEEIRKLADRVGGSTGEVRVLIDEIRAAANTTVMATEDGSKAVDAGTRQFDELAGAFQQIVALVETTVEAAREIELSTKQQATAVEQVNVAIHDAAQAARETEASSQQTLQTSSQLAEVSRGLVRMMRDKASA